MSRRTRRQSARTEKSKPLALVLIGAGLVILGFTGLLLFTRSASTAAEERSAIPISVEFPAPELALHDLQGKPVSLADYRGQVVLVNNWAIWCPPCKAEMPTLQAYFEDYRQQGFTIVAIESGDPARQVAEFVESYNLTFDIWLDPTQQALLVFRNPGLPSSYVVDRDGKVRLAWTGAISRKMLEQYVTPLLEE